MKATFSKSIDATSFACSDVTVTNGTCNSITPLSGNAYTLNITATSPGTIQATIHANRVQTVAGNINGESTGLNTLSYGLNSASLSAINGQCSALRTYTTSKPSVISLSGQLLCARGAR